MNNRTERIYGQMNIIDKYQEQVQQHKAEIEQDAQFHNISKEWIDRSISCGYYYNFTWMGRPIIQYPQDIVAMQELIWEVKPDLIIETGIAHGGGLVFYASMLELIGGDGQVLGVEQHIFPEIRSEIEGHRMFRRITMLEGNSVSDEMVKKVSEFARGKAKVMVALDSNHTHEHVLSELELYSPFVTKGSYLVVFDTMVNEVDESHYANRPWGANNNPGTAVEAFLAKNERFEADKSISSKLQITSCPGGFLKCVADET